MHVTIAYGHKRQPVAYGPVPDRHPPVAPGPAQAAIAVPLHPAEATDLGTWPRPVHASLRIATAIARAVPAAGATGPTVLMLTSPTTGMLTAVGPFDTADHALAWLRRNGRPGGGITSTPLPLTSPPGGHGGVRR